MKVAPRGRKWLWAVYFGCGLADGAGGRADPAFAELGWGAEQTSGPRDSGGRLRAETPQGSEERGVGGGTSQRVLGGVGGRHIAGGGA